MNDDRFLDIFCATETWGADNVSFPGECYRTVLEELYRGDALLKGAMRLAGRPAKLESIVVPTLAVTFEHDHIVPHRSASILLERIGSKEKEHVHLPGGHVGAVISTRGARELWPRISAFWRRLDELQESESLGFGPSAPLVSTSVLR